MLVVIALGGNALLRRGEAPGIDAQRGRAAVAARAVAEIARRHDVVVTHGNGPQVGFAALRNEAARAVVPAAPLDVLGAETEGMIGYLLEQELRRALPGRECATLLTQTVVDADDPAFAAPAKPIGPVYPSVDAARRRGEPSWSIGADAGGWRRVVASPEPRAIVELATIALLVRSGVVTICAGGGGIPVVVDDHGAFHGVEAVVDKDLASALLAHALDAHFLALLTDVEGVFVPGVAPGARLVRRAGPSAIRALALPPGSMGPKAEAAARFADGGGCAVIASLAGAADALAGVGGTTVEPGAGDAELAPPPAGPYD